MLEEINSDIIISEMKPSREATGKVSVNRQKLLQAVIEFTSSSLIASQRNKLFEILLYYEDVFAVYAGDLGVYKATSAPH